MRAASRADTASPPTMTRHFQLRQCGSRSTPCRRRSPDRSGSRTPRFWTRPAAAKPATGSWRSTSAWPEWSWATCRPARSGPRAPRHESSRVERRTDAGTAGSADCLIPWSSVFPPPFDVAVADLPPDELTSAPLARCGRWHDLDHRAGHHFRRRPARDSREIHTSTNAKIPAPSTEHRRQQTEFVGRRWLQRQERPGLREVCALPDRVHRADRDHAGKGGR